MDNTEAELLAEVQRCEAALAEALEKLRRWRLSHDADEGGKTGPGATISPSAIPSIADVIREALEDTGAESLTDLFAMLDGEGQ